MESQRVRDAIVCVLERDGAAGAEGALKALDESGWPDGVERLLSATPLERAAWIAPIDGYLVEGGEYLYVQKSNAKGPSYSPDGRRLTGGGVPCTIEDGSYATAFRFGPLDGRTLTHVVGQPIQAGTLFTDGDVNPADVLDVLGGVAALKLVSDRLAALVPIEPNALEALLTPMFGMLAIVEANDARLRAGAIVSRSRFELELEQGRRLYGHPLFLGYPTLASASPNGIVARHGTIVGAPRVFVQSSGLLRVADPCRVAANGDGDLLEAKPGEWHAEARIIERGAWGPRVAELRIWTGAKPEFEEVTENAELLVGVDSGMAGFFDAGEGPASGGDDAFVSACFEAAQKNQGVAAGPFGAWSESGLGDGGYDCLVSKDNGVVVAALIDFAL